LTRGEFEVSDGATWKTFQAKILTPVDAVAFIGHALISPFPVNNVTRAVGLCFFNFECVERLALPGDPEFTGPGFEGLVLYPPVTYPAIPLDTQAKIIFISACDMDVNMQNLLGITSSTHARALIVPQSATEVGMNMGEFAWEHIAEHLNDIPGVTTLSTAVAAANIDINNTTWLDSHGNPVAAVNWHVIGDGTIHF
jgi:hypothetical protein